MHMSKYLIPCVCVGVGGMHIWRSYIVPTHTYILLSLSVFEHIIANIKYGCIHGCVCVCARAAALICLLKI